MSLNQIVQNDFKFWMDPYVNSMRVDGSWSYKDGDKTPGDYLILNPDLIAEWNPVIPSLTGNIMCARIKQTTVTPSYTTLGLQPYINFSPYFTLSNSFINIVAPGSYIIYTCANLSSGLNSEMFSRVIYEASPTNFQEIIGSQTSIPAGCTIFGGTAPVTQCTNICSTSIIQIVNPNTRVGIQLRSTQNANLVNEFSYFLIQKIN